MNLRHFFIFWAGSLLCLYLAFSSTVNIPYVCHDSVRQFHKFYNHDIESKDFPIYRYMVADGRILAATLEQLIYKNVNHLSDLSRVRFMVIVVFALCASLIAMAAQSLGVETVPAFCLSTLIFTLPGVQNIIFAPYLSLAAAILLSVVANFILLQKLIYGLNVIIAFILLEIVFFMYPPAAFFFLLPAMFVVIFHNNWEVSRKILLRDTILWFLAAFAYFLLMKIFYYSQIKSTGHEIAFSGKQIWSFISNFFPYVVPQIFNLWNIYYSKALAASTLFFITLCIVIDFFVTRKMGWGRLAALAVLFLIFNMVWFLFGGYMPRQFIAAQALALALVYWSGEWIFNIANRALKGWSHIWAALFLGLGLIITDQMVTSNVLNSYDELMFIRNRISQFVFTSTKEIDFIRLKDMTRGYNGLPTVYDNFNGTITDYEMPDLVRAALMDMGQPFELHCIINYYNYGQAFTAAPNAVVINMNDLSDILSPERKK